MKANLVYLFVLFFVKTLGLIRKFVIENQNLFFVFFCEKSAEQLICFKYVCTYIPAESNVLGLAADDETLLLDSSLE